MGWADDRGFERWRSDAICLSNRLEARIPERGGARSTLAPVFLWSADPTMMADPSPLANAVKKAPRNFGS